MNILTLNCEFRVNLKVGCRQSDLRSTVHGQSPLLTGEHWLVNIATRSGRASLGFPSDRFQDH